MAVFKSLAACYTSKVLCGVFTHSCYQNILNRPSFNLLFQRKYSNYGVKILKYCDCWKLKQLY